MRDAMLGIAYGLDGAHDTRTRRMLGQTTRNVSRVLIDNRSGIVLDKQQNISQQRSHAR